jgi:hypothetical protein
MFCQQLNYLIGKDKTAETIKRYFMILNSNILHLMISKTAERVSGQFRLVFSRLDTNVEHDRLCIKAVTDNGDKTTVSLERIGRMPMPIDLLVEYTDGTTESFYVPLRLMSFEKQSES